MASACIDNIALSPETFPNCSPATYSSYTSRRKMQDQIQISAPVKLSDLPEEESDLEGSDIVDFEFRLDKTVTTMLPADELFSDGKLFPLNLTVTTATKSPEVSSPETAKARRILNGVSVVDSFLYSPKAPRCSSKWRELIGFKKTTSSPSPAPASRNSNGNAATRSIKQFLHRSSKSSNDSSVNLPLLNDIDTEPISISSSSRLSLSSSSSGHDPDDLPRLSLDSDKPKLNPNLNPNLNVNSNPNNTPRMKLVKTRTLSADSSTTTRIIDSPRMNASGKIVFHNLERSSSSPSTFNGGPKFKHRGLMERSYSANVRVTPVLNVAVCSKSGNMFGLPLFSSSHKQDSSGSNRVQNRNHHRA